VSVDDDLLPNEIHFVDSARSVSSGPATGSGAHRPEPTQARLRGDHPAGGRTGLVRKPTGLRHLATSNG
jgi:hypothetical protein